VWSAKLFTYKFVRLKALTFQLKDNREATDHPIRMRGNVLSHKLGVVKAQVISTRNMRDRPMLPSSQTRVDWTMVVPSRTTGQKETAQSGKKDPPPYSRNNSNK
jgi:hypothetical protein